MESTKATLETILEYLTPLLPLANSHTVDFIVGDAWTKLVPENIQTEVQKRGVDYTLDELSIGGNCHLSEFVRVADTYIIDKCSSFRDLDSLNFVDLVEPVKITEFMSNKKLHEVKCMSKVVANVANFCDTDFIVDVGSGKGYLTSILALHHRFRVLGLDCRETNIDGAVRTTTKLEVILFSNHIISFQRITNALGIYRSGNGKCTKNPPTSLRKSKKRSAPVTKNITRSTGGDRWLWGIYLNLAWRTSSKVLI